MNFDKIENDIKKLIKSGKIKSEQNLLDAPINKIYQKYNLQLEDLACYYCYKGHNKCPEFCKKIRSPE